MFFQIKYLNILGNGNTITGQITPVSQRICPERISPVIPFPVLSGAKILQDWRQRTQHFLSDVMLLPILYYVTARPSFPVSPVLYLVVLCSCLPTSSHSISWGNCEGICIHKSHVELGVAKKLQIWLEVKHPKPDFPMLGPKKRLGRETGSPPLPALALGLWSLFSSQ